MVRTAGKGVDLSAWSIKSSVNNEFVVTCCARGQFPHRPAEGVFVHVISARQTPRRFACEKNQLTCRPPTHPQPVVTLYYWPRREAECARGASQCAESPVVLSVPCFCFECVQIDTIAPSNNTGRGTIAPKSTTLALRRAGRRAAKIKQINCVCCVLLKR